MLPRHPGTARFKSVGDFCACYLHSVICAPGSIFRYKVTEGGADSKCRFSCLHGKRTAAFRNLCPIGYSVYFRLPHLPYVPYSLRIVGIVKITREREAKRLQTKGKKLKRMAITLKDRKETINLRGNVYELTLLWNREDIRRCAFGMAPDYAHIRKDGKNFALIACYSNSIGLSVENFHWVLVKPEWEIYFRNEDINTIPLEKLLKGLPIW